MRKSAQNLVFLDMVLNSVKYKNSAQTNIYITSLKLMEY